MARRDGGHGEVWIGERAHTGVELRKNPENSRLIWSPALPIGNSSFPRPGIADKFGQPLIEPVLGELVAFRVLTGTGVLEKEISQARSKQEQQELVGIGRQQERHANDQ